MFRAIGEKGATGLIYEINGGGPARTCRDIKRGSVRPYASDPEQEKDALEQCKRISGNQTAVLRKKQLGIVRQQYCHQNLLCPEIG